MSGGNEEFDMRIIRVACGIFALGLSSMAAGAQQAGPPRARSGLATPTPSAFGAGNVARFDVLPWDFSPTSSAIVYWHGDVSVTPYASFFASPALQAGASLRALDFSYCNAEPAGGDAFILQLVDTDAQNNILSTLGSIVANPGDGCTQKSVDLSGLNYTVDNSSHRLLLFLIYGPNATVDADTPGLITIEYTLQVSPPPSAATFSDVPPTDPAFQYVEALFASGISAGCGGGRFCPDNPVTRRQMAVFLSKALGLSYGFGTTNPTYVTIPEWQFVPFRSEFSYSDTGGSQLSRFPTTIAVDPYFYAPIHLPAGALLQGLEFQYCNDQPPNGGTFSLSLFGDSAGQLAAITTYPGEGCNASFADLSGANYTVSDRALYASVMFRASGDSTTRFQGAVLWYKLQVSPPPAAPTFNDVPSSDPGYQYIEALAASKITGGCGGGSYCPSSPVTRRQMAVFLAKALGLSYN
jgi:hypothetical protein